MDNQALNFDFTTAQHFLETRGLDMGMNLLAAIALWIVGRWAIRASTRVLRAVVMRSGKFDDTLAQYMVSIVNVLLTVLLVLAILQVFGIQTTSFAAMLAGIGLAVGTAWGGLLAHFAAGVFMQVLRPFKVGDSISAGGVSGTVRELGLFGTTIITADNVPTLIGNNKIFSDNIVNYSATPYRRVELTAKLDNSADLAAAIEQLRQAVARVPNVRDTPVMEIGILQLAADGPLLFVRPYTVPVNYWQVYYDTNRAILEALSPPPAPDAPVVQGTTA